MEKKIREIEATIKSEIASCLNEDHLLTCLKKAANFQALYVNEVGVGVMNWIYGGLLEAVEDRKNEILKLKAVNPTMIVEAIEGGIMANQFNEK